MQEPLKESCFVPEAELQEAAKIEDRAALSKRGSMTAVSRVRPPQSVLTDLERS